MPTSFPLFTSICCGINPHQMHLNLLCLSTKPFPTTIYDFFLFDALTLSFKSKNSVKHKCFCFINCHKMNSSNLTVYEKKNVLRLHVTVFSLCFHLKFKISNHLYHTNVLYEWAVWINLEVNAYRNCEQHTYTTIFFCIFTTACCWKFSLR